MNPLEKNDLQDFLQADKAPCCKALVKPTLIPLERAMAEFTRQQIAAETQNVHIEHYFPKGYDPDQEPWKSIVSFHKSAIEKAIRPYSDGWIEQAQRDASEIVRLEAIIESVEATNVGCPSKWPKGYTPKWKDGIYRWVSDTECRAAHASEPHCICDNEVAHKSCPVHSPFDLPTTKEEGETQ